MSANEILLGGAVGTEDGDWMVGRDGPRGGGGNVPKLHVHVVIRPEIVLAFLGHIHAEATRSHPANLLLCKS